MGKHSSVANRIRVVSLNGASPCQAEDDEVVFVVDRNGPLGNPHHMRDRSMSERLRVIEQHREALPQILRDNPGARELMTKICDTLQAGHKVALACHCAPLPCHGDNIRDHAIDLATRPLEGKEAHMILAADIGTKTGIENWPTNDLDGLLDALSRWPLDVSLDLSTDPAYADRPGQAPFRGRAWGHCVTQYNEALQKNVAVATMPLYPDHPDAVRYFGNFVGHSFPFWLDTDDADLIRRLDLAISENLDAQNMARHQPEVREYAGLSALCGPGA